MEQIYELENILHDNAYSTNDIQMETGVYGYDWSETMNDLKRLGIKTSKLDPEKYYGYDIENKCEVTLEEYIEKLKNIIEKEKIMKQFIYDEKQFYAKFREDETKGFEYLMTCTDDEKTIAILKDLVYLHGEVDNGYPYEIYKEYREEQLLKLNINVRELWRAYA